MDLTLHKPGDHNFIRSVNEQGVVVTDTLYSQSLVISKDRLVRDWPVHALGDLEQSHLEPIFELEPEIVLLGTGSTQGFLPPRLLMAFYEKNIGIEAMTTEAACRTFNVLLSEERNAVAALILPA